MTSGLCMDMATSAEFFDYVGAYSWIILITIVLCNFSSFGFLLGNLGPLSNLFPQHFGRDQVETNIITSIALAIFSLSSKCGCWLFLGLLILEVPEVI